MRLSNRPVLVLAALNGLLGVAFGAFAAHGIADPQAKEWLRTGALYQMTHAAAALALVGRSTSSSALLSVGALLFAASLDAMALGAPRLVGALTPFGGALMLAGWAVALVQLVRARTEAT